MGLRRLVTVEARVETWDMVELVSSCKRCLTGSVCCCCCKCFNLNISPEKSTITIENTIMSCLELQVIVKKNLCRNIAKTRTTYVLKDCAFGKRRNKRSRLIYHSKNRFRISNNKSSKVFD